MKKITLGKFVPAALGVKDAVLTRPQIDGFVLATPNMPRWNKDSGIGTHKEGTKPVTVVEAAVGEVLG